MNKIFVSILAFASLLLFTGCPVGVNFPPGTPGTEKIDKKLIGTWSNDQEDPEVKKVTISKADAYTYEVEVLEKGSLYMANTDHFKGYVTKIDGKNFVYFLEDKDSGQYFLYNYNIEDGKLKTYDVGLKVGGIDAVTSTEAFREEIKASLKMEDCLSGEIVWKKE